MKVNEIFLSIEGEGIRTGRPAVFIRLFGCNLDCTYCDSAYACKGDDYEELSVPDICELVQVFNCKYVTLTGGEPLIHKDAVKLVNNLCRRGFEVNIETNGAINLENFMAGVRTDYRKNIILTMDWKSYSSGMADKMLLSNLKCLNNTDVLKFVVGDKNDLLQMMEIIQVNKLECHIFVSPVFGKIDPKHLVDFILVNKLHNVRVQLQLHKFIWDPEMRGV